MLEGLKCDVPKEVILKTKELVYDLVVRHIEVEGFPTMANVEFREPNVNDLVLLILNPILSDFRRSTGRNIRLRQEKQIISIDGETGGEEEFVVMDVIKIKEKRFVFIVESMRSSIGEGMKPCLLTMKDMRDNGFITTGDSWRMFSYDGINFQMTRKIEENLKVCIKNESYGEGVFDCGGLYVWCVEQGRGCDSRRYSDHRFVYNVV